MNKKIIFGLIVILFFINGEITIAEEECPSSMYGSGTEESPCMITTCQQLQDINKSLKSNYVLANDIDCSGFKFKPIGSGIDYFDGTLDGDYNKIIDLEIDIKEDYVAIFNKIELQGVVRDLKIENIFVNGKSSVAGISIRNRGKIKNCHLSGHINGSMNIAGLVHSLSSEGSIINSSFIGNVDDNSFGGLTNINSGEIIDSCTNINFQNSGVRIGGLISNANYGKIERTCSGGSINGSHNQQGFVDRNYGIINNSFTNVKNNNGNSPIGTNSKSAIIDGFFNIGDSRGFNVHSYSGLIDRNYGIIRNCYNSGDILDTKLADVFGISWRSSGIIENCYNSGILASELNSAVGIANGNDIKNSFNIGALSCRHDYHYVLPIVKDYYYTANIAGETTDGWIEDGKITNCYFDSVISNSAIRVYEEEGFEYIDTHTTENDHSYYFNKNNEPMASWDFEDVWVEHPNRLPTLKWFEEWDNDYCKTLCAKDFINPQEDSELGKYPVGTEFKVKVDYVNDYSYIYFDGQNMIRSNCALNNKHGGIPSQFDNCPATCIGDEYCTVQSREVTNIPDEGEHDIAIYMLDAHGYGCGIGAQVYAKLPGEPNFEEIGNMVVDTANSKFCKGKDGYWEATTKTTMDDLDKKRFKFEIGEMEDSIHSLEGKELTLDYIGKPSFKIEVRKDQNFGSNGGYAIMITKKEKINLDLAFANNPSGKFYYRVMDDEGKIVQDEFDIS